MHQIHKVYCIDVCAATFVRLIRYSTVIKDLEYAKGSMAAGKVFLGTAFVSSFVLDKVHFFFIILGTSFDRAKRRKWTVSYRLIADHV